MNVNVKFSGAVEKILEAAITCGYAATKTEALRLGVFELNNKYKLLEQLEDRQDVAEFEKIEKEMSIGKTKVHKAASVDEIFA